MDLRSAFICSIFSKETMEIASNTHVRASGPEDVAKIILRGFPMTVTWRVSLMYSTLQYRASI